MEEAGPSGAGHEGHGPAALVEEFPLPPGWRLPRTHHQGPWPCFPQHNGLTKITFLMLLFLPGMSHHNEKYN